MKSDRKLYLTRDRSKVVEKGDPQGVTLLIAAGGNLDAATAQKYGLSLEDGKIVLPGAEPEPEEAEVAEVEETEEEVEEAPKPKAKKPTAKLAARKK